MTASDTEKRVFKKVQRVSFLRLTSSLPYTSWISPVLIILVPCMLRFTNLPAKKPGQDADRPSRDLLQVGHIHD